MVDLCRLLAAKAMSTKPIIATASRHTDPFFEFECSARGWDRSDMLDI